MTAETRQAVIAESNRVIAARAATNASRRGPETDRAGEPLDSEWDGSEGGAQASASDLESAFARLVQDLQSTSARSRLS
ncbi:MAG: hypothetical protein M3Z15_02200 [Pseudomonadota bacterium]|nr:hypothetical protein [Pseudomonadota bacterium]MDQ6925868.1 hypothetical protein [Candidatus Eremiobacteraeota bacterium]